MSTRQAPRARIRLTARGAIAAVFAATLVGHGLAGIAGSTALSGMSFIAGCLTAALLINRREMLSLVVAPPLVYFCATLLVEVVAAIGAPSMAQALGIGLFQAMSAGAPWLFVGSALVLAVTWRRGLVSNVRALREEVRASRSGGRTGGVPRPRQGEGGYAPEPEGYFEPRVYGKPRGDRSARTGEELGQQGA